MAQQAEQQPQQWYGLHLPPLGTLLTPEVERECQTQHEARQVAECVMVMLWKAVRVTESAELDDELRRSYAKQIEQFDSRTPPTQRVTALAQRCCTGRFAS